MHPRRGCNVPFAAVGQWMGSTSAPLLLYEQDGLRHFLLGGVSQHHCIFFFYLSLSGVVHICTFSVFILHDLALFAISIILIFFSL